MNHKRKIVPIMLCAMFLLPMSARAETVGQQFRDIMAQIDKQCRKDKMGPYLDPKDPDYIHKRPITDCDILKIKPVDPLATEEGRFAYAIKLPPPHDKPKVKFQPGMSAESYFKELCEKEAGEWIFKTVEGVEGIFQGRRNIPQWRGSALLFWADETTEVRTRMMEDVLVQPIYGQYNYMERPQDSDEVGKPFVRFFRGAENKEKHKLGFPVRDRSGRFFNVPYIVNQEHTDTLKSRYGFTWRQLSTTDMLENAIVGGETIIYDRTTSEVVAFRRFFERVWPRKDSRYTHLTDGAGCYPKFTGGVSNFVQKVLAPVNPVE